MRRRGLALLLFAGLLQGCPDQAPTPSELAIEPASGRDDVAIPVVVRGRFLLSSVRVDYQSPAKSDVRERVKLSLGDVPLGDVARTDATRHPACGDAPTCISATVPADIAPGTYDLVVVDPEGQRTTLPAAYRVLAPAERLTALRFAPIEDQRAGVDFAVQITALDDEQVQIPNLDADLSLFSPTEGDMAQVRLRAGRFEGDLALTVAAPSTHLEARLDEMVGSSAPFAVRAGPADTLQLAGPDALAAGTCVGPFELSTHDQFGNRVGVTEDTALRLRGQGPAGFGVFVDAACAEDATAAALTAGADTFAFYLRGEVAGPATVRAEADGFTAAELSPSVVAGAPHHLRLAAVPETLEAGACSDAAQVHLEDRFDNPAPPAEALDVAWQASPPQLEVFSDAGCATAAPRLVFGANISDLTVHLRATLAGAVTLELSAPGVASTQATLTVHPAAPVALQLAPAVLDVEAGDCSPALTVSSHDAYGNLVGPAAATPLGLATAPSGDLAVFEDAACAQPASPATLPRAGTRALFVRGARAGAFTLTASAPGFSDGVQQTNVSAGPAARLSFVAPPAAGEVGQCVGLDLQREDAFGNPAPVTASSTVAIEVTGGDAAAFDDPACASPASHVSLATGAATTTVYLRGTQVAAADVTARAGALFPATATVDLTEGPPAALTLSPEPSAVVAGGCAGPLVVGRVDAFGNPSVLAPTTQVTLTSAGTLSFFDDPGCASPVSAAPIPSGSASVSVYVSSSLAQVTDVRASAAGAPDVARAITVRAAAPTQIAFTGPAVSVAAGDCSPALDLVVRDAFGNLAPGAADRTIALAAAPSAGFAMYSDAACGSAATSLTVAAGASATRLYVRGTVAGSVTVSASSPGLTGDDQVAQIEPGAPAALEIASAAMTVNAGDCSPAMQVNLRDAFGNLAPAAAATSVGLTTAPAGRLSFFSDPSCGTGVTALTVAPGATGGQVYFTAALTGPVDVTVSGTGLTPDTQGQTIDPAAPRRIVFLTTAQTVTAGACSGVVEIETRDVFGNRTPLTAPQALTMAAAPALGVSFFTDAACASPAASFPVAAGQSRRTLYVRATTAGPLDLTASMPGLSDATQTWTVDPAAPSAFVFTTSASPLAAGACSPAVGVEARDAFGNVSPVASNEVLNATGVPGATFTAYADAACATPVVNLPLPAGTSAATFYFTRSQVGAFDLRVSGAGIGNATQGWTVTAGPPAQLAFTSPAPTGEAGVCLGPLDLELRDAFGNPTVAVGARTITLSGPAGAGFFSDAGCASAAATIALTAGQGTGARYVRGTLVGAGPVTAQSAGSSDGTTSLTVTAAAPASLQITNPARTVAAGACSAVISIRTEDAFGNVSAARTPLSLGLAASPGAGFSFFSDAGCATPAGSLALPTGQSAASLYFSGTAPGAVDVTVSGPGLSPASQAQTVTAGAPSALVFTSAPQTVAAGVCSSQAQLQIRDAYGNPATQGTSRTVTLTPTAFTGLSLYSDPGCTTPTSSALVAAGQSSLGVYFSGAIVGTPAIDAASAGLTGASQAQQIDPAPASELVFVGTPVNVRAGACSPAFTVETRDTFGNVAPVAAPTTVNLVANPVGGLSFFVDAGCVQALSSVGLPAGTSQATLYVSGAVTQPVTIGANATGLTAAAAVITVVPDTAAALAITSSSHTATAGQCSGAVIATTEDQFGNFAPVTASTWVTPSAPGASFFADATCTTPAVAGILTPGATQTILYFSRTLDGTFDLTLSSPGLTSAVQSQQILPGPPAILTVVTPAQTVTAGACSAITTVQRTDAFGNPSFAATPTAFTLSAAPSANFTFYSDSGCSAPVTGGSIAGGADQASFYFMGTDAVVVDVTAASAGLTSADQGETIQPAVASQFSFVTPPRTFTAGTCSERVRVQTDDAYGNRSDVAADTLLTFASAPSGLTYFDDDTCTTPIGSKTVSAGSSRTRVYLSSDVAGDLALGVSSPGFTTGLQTQTVDPDTPTQLVFTSTPKTVVAGACSTDITVQTRDQYGNPAGIGSDSVITLSAAPSAGLTFYEDAGCTISATSLTLSASGTGVRFYLRSTVAGAVTVTVRTPGRTDGVQAETIIAAPPSKLEFATNDKKLQINTCSTVATVEVLDPFDNRSAPASALTLTLTSSPAVGLTFYSDAACGSLITTVDVLAGTTTADFYFSATAAGTYDLTASAAGVTAATQIAEIRDDCGNGILNPGETCDDGNTSGGDGCSAACALESGWVCARSPSVCFTEATTSIVDSTATCPGSGTVASPYCMVWQALFSSRPNTIVGPGTYSATLILDGVTRTLVGEDGAVLRASLSHTVEIRNGADITLQGFTIQDASQDVIEVNDTSRLTLLDALVQNSSTHCVHSKDNAFVMIKRSIIRAASTEGAVLDGRGGYDIENTVFTNNGREGVQLQRRAAGSRFVNNTVVANTAEGIDCRNSDVIKNSILRDNGGGSYSGGCAVSYSALQAADANPTNFVAACPLTGTYQLQVGSPCIDVGDALDAPDHDRLHQSRPQGLGYDVGADEGG